MRIFFLFGYYGRNNFGDDLMLDSLMKYFAKHRAKKILLTNNCISTTKNIQRYPRNLYYFLKSCFICTDFILTGGSWFHDNYEKKNKYFFFLKIFFLTIILFFLNLIGKKIYFLGVSVGPFKKTSLMRILMFILLSIVTKLMVRDKKSFEEIKLINNKFKKKTLVGRDLTELFFKNLKKKNNKKNILGISVLDLNQFHNNKNNYDKEIFNKIFKLIDIKLNENKNLKLNIFALWTPNDKINNDLNIAKQLITKINPKYKTRIKIVIYKNNSQKILNEMLKCKYFISTRLHSLLASFYLGLNFNCISYNDKCLDSGRLLKIDYKRFLNIKKIQKDKDVKVWFDYLFKNRDEKKITYEKELMNKINLCLQI